MKRMIIIAALMLAIGCKNEQSVPEPYANVIEEEYRGFSLTNIDGGWSLDSVPGSDFVIVVDENGCGWITFKGQDSLLLTIEDKNNMVTWKKTAGEDFVCDTIFIIDQCHRGESLMIRKPNETKAVVYSFSLVQDQNLDETETD